MQMAARQRRVIFRDDVENVLHLVAQFTSRVEHGNANWGRFFWVEAGCTQLVGLRTGPAPRTVMKISGATIPFVIADGGLISQHSYK